MNKIESIEELKERIARYGWHEIEDSLDRIEAEYEENFKELPKWEKEEEAINIILYDLKDSLRLDIKKFIEKLEE